MNRHNSYQQPETTADNANAKQWQVDLSEQDTGKVGNDSDAGGADDGRNANDANHTSDQGESVEVRVIKGDRGEPNDRPGQVEQGGQAVRTGAEESQYSTNVDPGGRNGRVVKTSTETQSKKRGIIELLGSSPLGVMAQTALDSVRHSVHEIQVDRQIKLIDKTVSNYYGAEAQQDYNQLNKLVDEGKIKLSDSRVFKRYLEHINRVRGGEAADNNTEFIKRFIQEDKINLSKSEIRQEYLNTALSRYSSSDYFGVQEAISTGKLDLSNEETADQFLDVMNEDDAFNTYGINLLETSGISPEKIVDNEHIQQLAIERMRDIASETPKDPEAIDKYWHIKTFGNSYLADVLDKVCSNEEGRRRLKESIDMTETSVQELGESSEMAIFDTFEEWSDGQIANIVKYNNVLRKLGWQPSGEALLEKMSRLDGVCRGSMLHGDDLGDELALIQDKAQELGLITPDIVDRLYTNAYHKLLDMAKKGKDLGGTAEYIISPNLLPSGNDPVANYWREQSSYLGNNAMQLCVAKALDMTKEEQDDGQRLDLSDLIDENGILKDALFQNRPGSFLYQAYCSSLLYKDGVEWSNKKRRFLEAHRDQTSEADGSRAMVDLLGKMKGQNGKYDAEAIKQFSQSMGDLCINHSSELFDGDKLTDKFYSASFKRYYYNKDADKFMSYIDGDWKNHYGDTGRKYLELVSTYPDHPSKDERTQWIRDYFDAGGPTGELFDGILCDYINAEVFLENPDLCSKLSNDQKDFINIYKYYRSSVNDKISSSISEGRADIIRGTLTVDSLVNKLLNEIPLDIDKINLLCDCQDAASRLLNSNEKSLAKFCVDYKDYDGFRGYRSVLSSLSMIRNDSLDTYFDANGPTNKMKDEILFRRVSFLRDHPELQESLSGDRKSLIKFCDKYSLNERWIDAYELTADNLADYFDANGPTNKMKDKILFRNISFFYDHPELQESLSGDRKSLIKFCKKYQAYDDILQYRFNSDNLADYLDVNGPKPKFWQDTLLSDTHCLNLVYQYYQNQDEAGRKRMGLDDKQIAVAKGYGSIGEGDDWNDSRKLFESYIKEHYDELTIDQIGWTASIMARLTNSNASELAERSEAFTHELLKLDVDKIPEALDRIEDIYIHNHLPYVGKNYLVFRTMHPSPNLKDDFYFDNGKISPVLQQATGDIRSGKLDQMLNSRDAIIVSDLLRASLGSNNRSIREYLDTLKNGQALFDQLNSGELDWNTFNQPTNLMDRDTKANYDTLSTFAWHLATIYNSTLTGKEYPYQLIHQQSGTDESSAQPNALQADFANLTSLIKPNSRYSLADRAVRYFAHFVGVNSLADAEQYMDNIVKEADARNRKTAEYLATTSEPKLQPGDLVKGMGGTDGDGIRYLSYAFQNGSISKEYLGDASRSDTTPLDADASIVLDLLNGEQTINQIMGNRDDRRMLAEAYGSGLWVVLRPDEDRFIITRRDKHEADQSVYDLSVPDANFDRTDLTQEEIDRRLKEIAEAKRHRREGLPKLEIFATGVDGDGHYGIRTGFGMDKVSYYISDRTTRTGKSLGWFNGNKGEEYTLVSEVTKLEIALNGFYIPIVDRDSEELIFTPDDYDKMRQQMSGLSYYHTGDYQFAPDSDLELGELTLDRESITIPSTSTIISELPASMAETDHKHEVINQAIKQAITNIPELNLSYKDYLDGDLTENIVEMIDTGSTGRQTNAPGSGDFDYLARLDRSILNDPTKKQQITDALLTAFGRENDGSAIVNGNLRLKQVSIDGLAEPVDIDITFAQKTNKVQYPTDAALADRLSNIKNQSETKYQQVLANIIYAKQFLKAAGAYKPRRSPEAKGIGGLGGVGIENWVLQHGGSFKQAARDFLSVADNCSGFEDFCAHYPVWDYGENHKGIRSKPHDNFVADNMNPEGYERMKEALRAVAN